MSQKTGGFKRWLRQFASTILDPNDEPRPRSEPPVIDLAGERSRSRVLSSLVFFIILLFVSTLIFPSIFYNPMPRLGVQIATDIDISTGPADNTQIGGVLVSEFGGPMRIWVKNAAGYPVTGIDVSLSFEPMQFSDRSSYDICAFIFNNTDILAQTPAGSVFLPYFKSVKDNVIVAERFQPYLESDACKLVLQGNLTEKTDSDGIASFGNITVKSAVAGEYLVTIKAGEVVYQTSINLVSENLVAEEVGKVYKDLEVGKPCDVQFLVKDALYGQPVANKVVYVVSGQGDYGADRLSGVYKNNVATTNENGIVTFKQLTLVDHEDDYASLTVVSGGQVIFFKRVGALEGIYVKLKNVAVSRKSALTVEISAKVVNYDTSVAVAGKRVFASVYSREGQVVIMNQFMDTNAHGDDWFLNYYGFDEFPNMYKSVLNGLSPPSDGQGNVKWIVEFTEHGEAGAYTLRLRGGSAAGYDNVNDTYVEITNLPSQVVAAIDPLYAYNYNGIPFHYEFAFMLLDKDNKPCAYKDVTSTKVVFEDCSTGTCVDISSYFTWMRTTYFRTMHSGADGIIYINIIIKHVTGMIYVEDMTHMSIEITADDATFVAKDTVSEEEKTAMLDEIGRSLLIGWDLTVSDTLDILEVPYGVSNPFVTQTATVSITSGYALYTTCSVIIACGPQSKFDFVDIDVGMQYKVTCPAQVGKASTIKIEAKLYECFKWDDPYPYEMGAGTAVYDEVKIVTAQVLPQWKSLYMTVGETEEIVDIYDGEFVISAYAIGIAKTAWFQQYIDNPEFTIFDDNAKAIIYSVVNTRLPSVITSDSPLNFNEFQTAFVEVVGPSEYETENFARIIHLPRNVTFADFPSPTVNEDIISSSFVLEFDVDIPYGITPYIKTSPDVVMLYSMMCEDDAVIAGHKLCTVPSDARILVVGKEIIVAAYIDVEVCIAVWLEAEMQAVEECAPLRITVGFPLVPPLMNIHWVKPTYDAGMTCTGNKYSCEPIQDKVHINVALGQSFLFMTVFSVDGSAYNSPYEAHMVVQQLDGFHNETAELLMDNSHYGYTVYFADIKGEFRLTAYTGKRKTAHDIYLSVRDVQPDALFTQATVGTGSQSSKQVSYIVGQNMLKMTVKFQTEQINMLAMIDDDQFDNPWMPLSVGGVEYGYFLFKETPCIEKYNLLNWDGTSMLYYPYADMLKTCEIKDGDVYLSSLEGPVTKLTDSTLARPSPVPVISRDKSGMFGTNWDHACIGTSSNIIAEAPSGKYYIAITRGQSLELAKTIDIESQETPLNPIDGKVKIYSIDVVNPIIIVAWIAQPEGLEKKDPWSTDTQALVGKSSSMSAVDILVKLDSSKIANPVHMLKNMRIICQAHDPVDAKSVLKDVTLMYDAVEPYLKGTELHLKLPGLRFSKAATGEYILSVSIAGVVSKPSDVISVRDPYDGSTDSMDKLKTFLYIGAAASVPLFWGTADRHSPWSILVAGVAGIVMIVVFLMLMMVPQGFPLYENGKPDEFAQFFLFSFLSMLVIFLILLVWAVIKHLKRRKLFKVEGESKYNPILPSDKQLVMSLLDPIYKKTLFGDDNDTQRDAQEKYLLGFMPKKKLMLLRKFHMDNTTPEEDAQRLKNPKDDINKGKFMQKIWNRVKFALRLKIKKMLWVENMNLHKPFEKNATIPQRMLFACVASLWLCVIICMVCIVATVWFDYQMESVRLAALKHRLEVTNLIEKFKNSIDSGIEVLKMINSKFGTEGTVEYPASVEEFYSNSKEMPWRDRFFFMLSNGLGFLSGSNPSATSDRMNTLITESGTWLDDFLDMLTTTVYVAVITGAVLALVVTAVLWRGMMSKYKANLYLLRQKKYWFNSKTDFPVYNACFYVGLQMGKMLVVSAILTIVLVAICLALSFLQYNITVNLVISIGTPVISVAAILQTFMDQLGRTVATDGGELVIRPKAFAVYDFVMLIVYFLGGIVCAIGAFFGKFKKTITKFARCDTPLVFTDPGYPPNHPPWESDDPYVSYMAMMLLHHRHTCPVMRVWCYLLLKDMYNNRARQASEDSCVEAGVEMSHHNESPMHTNDPHQVPEDDCMEVGVEMTSPACVQVKSPTPGDHDTDQKAALRRRRVVSRWNKLYTLVRNPQLVKLSKNYCVDVCGKIDYGEVADNRWRPTKENMEIETPAMSEPEFEFESSADHVN